MKLFENKEMAHHLVCDSPTAFGKCLGLNQKSDPHIKQIRLSREKGAIIEPHGPEIIGFMKRYLPLTGTLEMDDKGYIYLDLSDEIIFQLSALISSPHAEIPPYFGPERSYGAHVSVVLGKEENPMKLKPYVIGETFSITPKGCFYIEPTNWQEVSRVHFITVDAPSLSEIRTSMGLSPFIQEESFYITLAVTPRFLSLEGILKASSEVGGPMRIECRDQM